MKKWFVIFLSFTLLFVYTSLSFAQKPVLRISSTTSTDNTGLFAMLNPPFEDLFNCQVHVIAQGTGKALKTGEMGDCDVVFVHSRAAEDKFIADGYGVNRRDVMYNDFVIIGPKDDPAGIKGIKDATEALKRIASANVRFVSRGDESGTHKKEKEIWEKAGTTPKGQWYIESGQGMGAVLMQSNELNAYTISDRGTYLKYIEKVQLEVLTEGDPILYNPYGIIAVNPARHRHVNYIMAMAYIGWVTSQEGQKIINDFGRDQFGQPFFIPLAISFEPVSQKRAQ